MDKLDIRPFKIHIPDIDVADLSERIKRPDRYARSLELIKIFDEIFAEGSRRMAPDPRRQRAGVRRGRHPRRHSQRPAMFQKWFRQARASRLLP
jgi:hypothetical protein